MLNNYTPGSNVIEGINYISFEQGLKEITKNYEDPGVFLFVDVEFRINRSLSRTRICMES